MAVPVELGGGAVQREHHVLPGRVARAVDRLQQQLDRGGVRRQVGREAAFVADRSGHALGIDQRFQLLKDLGAAAQGLAERLRADRHDHQLLHVEVVVGVRAAVDHVHHRHRHLHRARAAEIAVQRQAGFLGRGLGRRHRHREHRVGAQARLVLGAVEVDQRLVDEGLLGGVQADDRLRDLGVDRLDRLQHALAAVAALVAVAQLERLAAAGRGARGHRGAAHDAGLEQHVRLDRRVAARIEDFSGDYIDDGAHFVFTFSSTNPLRLTSSVELAQRIKQLRHQVQVPRIRPVAQRVVGIGVRFHENTRNAGADRRARQHRRCARAPRPRRCPARPAAAPSAWRRIPPGSPCRA